jgi:hypothetical protein
MQHDPPTPLPHDSQTVCPLHAPGTAATHAPPTASHGVFAFGLTTLGAGVGAGVPPPVHAQVAIGLPAHWHMALGEQSALD